MVSVLAVLVCMSCGGDDDEVLAQEGNYDTPVCFRVNTAGNGFVNIGTGTGYTATVSDGAFAEVSGRKVYNTGGTADGTYLIPWAQTIPPWTRYVGMGYVDLGAKTGELLKGDNWSIEIVFALHALHQADVSDQYICSFNTNTPFPDSFIGLCYREQQVRVRNGTAFNTGGSTDFVDFTSLTSWDAALTMHSTAKGQWAHYVVTKAADGTVSLYINGSEIYSIKRTDYPAFDDVTFAENYLGKTPYHNGGEDGANDVYGFDLPNTKFYHFAIDDKAWSADEVDKRFLNSPVGKGQLVSW